VGFFDLTTSLQIVGKMNIKMKHHRNIIFFLIAISLPFNHLNETFQLGCRHPTSLSNIAASQPAAVPSMAFPVPKPSSHGVSSGESVKLQFS